MKIPVNKKLREELVTRKRCEWCREASQDGLDPAHVIGKGAGGPYIRCNMVSLCRRCHSASHNSNIGNEVRPDTRDLLEIAGNREKVYSATILEVVWFISNQLKRGDSEERILEKMAVLSPAAFVLCEKELVSAGVLP